MTHGITGTRRLSADRPANRDGRKIDFGRALRTERAPGAAAHA